MEDIDVWRSAHHYMKRYGDDAPVRAAMSADSMLAEGDTEGFRVWTRIVAAINELSRQSPSSAEHVN
jgi:hypothetical protein